MNQLMTDKLGIKLKNIIIFILISFKIELEVKKKLKGDVHFDVQNFFPDFEKN